MKNDSPVTRKGTFTGRRGNPLECLKCGARTRRGTPCQRAAELNPVTGLRKRCRLHGGLSTGARTPEGRARIAAAHLKHGKYTRAARQARADLRARLAALKAKAKGISE
jgi:hypothetical protein